jgi:hypothetical protein
MYLKYIFVIILSETNIGMKKKLYEDNLHYHLTLNIEFTLSTGEGSQASIPYSCLARPQVRIEGDVLGFLLWGVVGFKYVKPVRGP